MPYPAAWLQGASLGENITWELRLQIIRGFYKPDTVLSENQLASEFGTSRSPVREALKVLAGEGLIRLERMGAVVIGMTPGDMEELFDVRLLIENFVTERLLRQDVNHLADKLNQIIDRMEIALKHKDVLGFSYQDVLFHESLVQAARHNRILHTWNNLRALILSVMIAATEKRFESNIVQSEDTIAKHRAVVNALGSKDARLVRELVQEHYLDTRLAVNDSVLSTYREITGR
ncbi:GntR family transcriptional regulator [Paenibacillus sp. JX-17]|uniref:GntR family transcriptional regulator n=1 Tax=Paenibacillus lacisoli TaxID=3064525 RepID=A0ABT9CCZ1_9BACL|nr:GntR family transcriptional regulator [Paenibacillus sp. JX-17]MDO7906745.1 GntR family transcriptional regulator [Paenibacillus sp. JX-17]